MIRQIVKPSTAIAAVVIVIAGIAGLAPAANTAKHQHHSNHTAASNHQHQPSTGYRPSEAGEAAFAAIAEIVTQLEQADDTDWEEVNIDQLRNHLVDMNHLMLHSQVVNSAVTDDHIQFEVHAPHEAVGAIHRMVPAHAGFIERERDWQTDTTLHDRGLTLTISVQNLATLTKLQALGFYGFMALGSHHPPHHYMMALGKMH
jgi:hypothetical protein